MKLSIIVPIYKVEKYLRKCVDSLLSQDLTEEEYEIILVDDGSPDNCGAIADEYAAKHPNIRAIHQENGGLSVARNTGIDAARGEYIQFVDSDDYLEPNVLKGLVDKMDAENLDVLRFDYQNVNEAYEVFQPYKDVKPFVDLRDEVCDGLTFLNERLGYACYAWQFIIRTDCINKQGLYFKPGIYFEDTEWTPRMLASAKRCNSTDTVVYNYLLRSGSITGAVSVEKKRKVLKDKISLLGSLDSQARSVEDARWHKGMEASTVLSILTLVSSDFYNERKSVIKEIKSLCLFPLSYYHTTQRVARKIRLINISPGLFCVLHHYKNK